MLEGRNPDVGAFATLRYQFPQLEKRENEIDATDGDLCVPGIGHDGYVRGG
jgi:hypothetical protein